MIMKNDNQKANIKKHQVKPYKTEREYLAAKESLDKVLTDLKKSCNVRVFVIVSNDGVALKATNPRDVSKETLGSMSASVFGATEMVLSQMMSGTLDRTIAESEKDRLIVMRCGSAALLVVVTDSSENLENILKEMDKTSEKIKKLLG